MKLLCLVFFLSYAFLTTDATFPIVAEHVMNLVDGLANKTRNFLKLAQVDDKEVDKFIQSQEAKSQQNNNQNASSGVTASVNHPGIPKPVQNIGSSLNLSTNAGVGRGPELPPPLNLKVDRKLGPLPPLLTNAGVGRGPELPPPLNLKVDRKLGSLPPPLDLAPGLSKSVGINIPKPGLNIGSSISSTANGPQTQAQLNLNTSQNVQPNDLNLAPGLTKSLQINVPAISKPALNISSSVDSSANGTQVPSQLNLNASQNLGQPTNLLSTNLTTSPIEKGAATSTLNNTVNAANQPLNVTGA